MSDFNESGYIVEVHKINAADYGVPQHRERVIIIGQRNDIDSSMLFQFPVQTHSNKDDNLPNWVSIMDALTDIPNDYNESLAPNAYGSRYRFVARNYGVPERLPMEGKLSVASLQFRDIKIGG